jgi:hypothetical protein
LGPTASCLCRSLPVVVRGDPYIAARLYILVRIIVSLKVPSTWMTVRFDRFLLRRIRSVSCGIGAIHRRFQLLPSPDPWRIRSQPILRLFPLLLKKTNNPLLLERGIRETARHWERLLCILQETGRPPRHGICHRSGISIRNHRVHHCVRRLS